jgi:hypothetical protein
LEPGGFVEVCAKEIGFCAVGVAQIAPRSVRSRFTQQAEKNVHFGAHVSRTLLTGLAFRESPRWHDGRLWFSNWVAQEAGASLAVDLEETAEALDVVIWF